MTTVNPSWATGINKSGDLNTTRHYIHYCVKVSGNLTNRKIYARITLQKGTDTPIVIDELGDGNGINPEASGKEYYISGFALKDLIADNYTLKFEGSVEHSSQTMTVHFQRVYVEQR